MLEDQDIEVIVERAYDQAVAEHQQQLNDTLYCIWIKDGDTYSPAVNTETCKSLPSGVYKVTQKDRAYFVNKIKINSDEIYTFSEDFTSRILEEVGAFWERKDLYKENKLLHKRGMLLEGIPGGGKTSVITLLIEQLIQKDGIVFLVNNYKDFELLNEVLNTIIRKIEPERPIITVIEDIDKLVEEGDDAELLDFLDGKSSIDHHVVIMTSNDTSELSEALLRPSRVDMRFVIPAPDNTIRKEYFQKKGVPKQDVALFVKETKGMSFAQLKEVFIGTQILNKPLSEVVQQLKNPLGSKDYLSKTKAMGF